MEKKHNHRLWPKITQKNDGWGDVSFRPNTGWNSGWDDNISMTRQSAFKTSFVARPPPIQPITTFKTKKKGSPKNSCSIL